MQVQLEGGYKNQESVNYDELDFIAIIWMREKDRPKQRQ